VRLDRSERPSEAPTGHRWAEVRRTGTMEYPRGKEQPQSCLMLAAGITLPQGSISALMRVANSPGVHALRAVVGGAYFTRRYVNNVGGPPYEGAGLRIFSSSAVMESTACFRSVPFQFGYELPST
jgi:hypothetical protein